MMKNTKKNVILSIFSLSVGGLIYLATRPASYISVFINRIIPLEDIQRVFSPLNIEFVNNYVPDFLWAFSLTCALLATNKSIKASALTVSLCGIIWEAIQFFGLTPGTGDIVDIIMYLTAVFTAVLINKKECSNYEKEQN